MQGPPLVDEPTNIIVSLTAGTTHLVLPRPKPKALRDDPQERWTESGLIYSDRRDMPSIEELLAEYKVLSAVIERPAAGLSLGRVAAAAALAAGIAATGWTLLATNIAGGGRPDATLSLALALGGLILLATVVTAIRR